MTTRGQPDTAHYVQMGRIVRTSGFDAPSVLVKDGAKLLNVWVDGMRGVPENSNFPRMNIRVLGGTGTTVSNNRDSETAGASALETYSTQDGYPCVSNTLTGNVITAYSSDNATHPADGMSIHCENSDVENNQVIDASDVAIIIFNASPAIQKSQVRNNTVVSAGNSVNGALGADPFFPPSDGPNDN